MRTSPPAPRNGTGRTARGARRVHAARTSEPLTLRATRWRCGFSVVFRREVCGGDFEGEIRRSRFGITHSLPFVEDRVRLLIEVEGIRQ